MVGWVQSNPSLLHHKICVLCLSTSCPPSPFSRHLGSLWEDSAKYGGILSSPLSHGFKFMNSTIEVAPTATTNCNCRKEWQENCLYGHYGKPTHCNGHEGPGGNNCCFNYWSPDPSSPHGVTNLTFPTPPDDSDFLASAFEQYIDSIDGAPFFVQISFHGCHIPYVATNATREACAAGRTCKPGSYSDAQLDFYGCLIELDGAVGRIVQLLKDRSYFDDTLIWFSECPCTFPYKQHAHTQTHTRARASRKKKNIKSKQSLSLPPQPPTMVRKATA